ncbi:uncharacterized protein LOC132048947 [Lycium ferocissimum]|uniref:uncharacterized protein LOC132048947 n=1 Tax=Lycium ferocissimum TaxID=112874 RepID=UPI00281627C5|nr:uncharacterized protein LOC132048947 [Lycium ferocissimum]
MLSAIKPPKCVINDLHKIFARFFWNNSEESRRRHWSSWLNLCMPKEEGGVGFRYLFDISKALCAKIWWKFRTTNTLWANDMWIKYCKRHSPQNVQWKGGSQVWKAMLKARDNIEHEIWWEPRNGTTNDGSNIGRLQQLFPMDIVDHILEELHFHEPTEEWDRPRWMMTASGKFTVGTTWELLRRKTSKSDVFKNMWILGEMLLQKFGHMLKLLLASQHSFNKSNRFFRSGGMQIAPQSSELYSELFQWLPCDRYGGGGIQFYMEGRCSLTKLRFPWQHSLPRCIPQILQVFEAYKPRIVSKIVKWEFPMPRWFKCNSDGASRGNPGPSSVAFCMRNAVGDLQFAESRRISDGSKLLAEAMALQCSSV